MGIIFGLLGKFKIDLVFLAIISALALTIYLCVGQISELTAKNAITEQKLAISEASKDAIVAEQKASTARANQLLSDLAQIRADADTKKVVIMKHDLNKIAKAKPRFLEEKINKAVREQQKRMESLSRE